MAWSHKQCLDYIIFMLDILHQFIKMTSYSAYYIICCIYKYSLDIFINIVFYILCRERFVGTCLVYSISFQVNSVRLKT